MQNSVTIPCWLRTSGVPIPRSLAQRRQTLSPRAEHSKPEYYGDMLEKRTYTRSLVSYLDLLGFSELVEESRSDSSVTEQIATLLQKLRRSSENVDRAVSISTGPTSEYSDTLTFSDHVVRRTKIINDAILEEIVMKELYILSEIQLDLLLQGDRMVRGGLCIGDLYLEEGLAFGPALVKAYELESKYAVYPRIVIDRDLIFNAQTVGYSGLWEDYFSRGEDGAFYVDYLFSTSLMGFFSAFTEAIPRIREHRRVIEAKISTAKEKNDERVKRKYIWTALYHNRTINRLVDRFKKDFPNEVETIAQLSFPDGFLQF